MSPAQHNFLLGLLNSIFADRPTESVSTWCERELIFREPDNCGPFNLIARSFIREPLDSFSDPMITDRVLVFAPQVGKSALLMGGTAWTIANEGARVLWCGPTRDKVRSFSRTRWVEMLKASSCLAKLIPTGAARHSFGTLEQKIGASVVSFAWSNSPAMLSSDPARMINLDEVDKFSEGTKRETNAVELADLRTRSFANPKRTKCSTPTLTTGLIWQEFLKTDQRRRFVQCIHCQHHVVLAWSKDFTVFPLTGEEAFVRWDQEARRKGGDWDLDRVERSAHFVCPHCGGQILDGQKTAMDRAGVWRPTAEAAKGFRGWHLPAWYASGVETSVGKLAVKFLQAKRSLLGLQGWINSTAVEPWENQESKGGRIEIVSPEDAPALDAPVYILTADYQAIAPLIWFVLRAWTREGHSRLVDFGPLDSFEELRAKQLDPAHVVADNHVGVDSGFASETVYAACLQYGKLIQRPNALPLFAGWVPMKAFDRDTGWNVTAVDAKGKVIVDGKRKPVVLKRPFNLGAALLPHRRFRLPLLEFSNPHVKDMLERLRAGRTRYRWEIIEHPKIEEYHRHLNSELRKPVYSPRTHRVSHAWTLKSRGWPNHLKSCELEQEVMALFHQLLPLGQELLTPEAEAAQPKPDLLGTPESPA